MKNFWEPLELIFIGIVMTAVVSSWIYLLLIIFSMNGDPEYQSQVERDLWPTVLVVVTSSSIYGIFRHRWNSPTPPKAVK